MKIAVRRNADFLSFYTLIDETHDDLLVYNDDGYSTVKKSQFVFYGELNRGSLIRIKHSDMNGFGFVEHLTENQLSLREIYNDYPEKHKNRLSEVFLYKFERVKIQDFRILYLAPSA